MKMEKNELFDAVILVHGIRTNAAWFGNAEKILAENCNVKVIQIRYGRLDTLRFLH
jgi:hypothetical protein